MEDKMQPDIPQLTALVSDLTIRNHPSHPPFASKCDDASQEQATPSSSLVRKGQTTSESIAATIPNGQFAATSREGQPVISLCPMHKQLQEQQKARYVALILPCKCEVLFDINTGRRVGLLVYKGPQSQD